MVRTRVFVRRIEDWEAVARVHGERFGGLGEIEAEAVIGASDAL